MKMTQKFLRFIVEHTKHTINQNFDTCTDLSSSFFQKFKFWTRINGSFDGLDFTN